MKSHQYLQNYWVKCQVNNIIVELFHYVNFFFVGLIKAIQLEYSESHKHLMNAIRKAPQQVAVGFKQHVRIIISY